MQLNGGTGELTGEAELSASRLDLDLRISSDQADMALQDHQFLKLRNSERSFEIFGAREKFDRYLPGVTDVFGGDE